MAETYQNYNYFQPSQFKVNIDRTKASNLEFYCQRISHPGIAVSSTSVPVSRLQTLSIPGDTLNYDELTMEIIIDEDFKAYSEFYAWLESLTVTRSDFQQIPNQTIIETDILVSILSSANNVVKQFKYLNCVPTSLGAINFEASVGETDIVTFPITFRIDTFEIITV